jgi:AcrR family transcriptional regulator
MPPLADPLPELDPRRAAILGAAFDTFCRYGFRRTAMEDIARAAGLSRAALYLHFANKPDIYRSLIQHYFMVTASRAAAALQPGMAPEPALAAFFAAKAGPELEAMFASPHGQELLDANTATAADIVRAGESRIAAVLAAWLHTEAAAGRLTLPDTAAATASTLVAALSGLKTPSAGIAGYRAAAARLAVLAGRGLRPAAS